MADYNQALEKDSNAIAEKLLSDVVFDMLVKDVIVPAMNAEKTRLALRQ